VREGSAQQKLTRNGLPPFMRGLPRVDAPAPGVALGNEPKKSPMIEGVGNARRTE